MVTTLVVSQRPAVNKEYLAGGFFLLMVLAVTILAIVNPRQKLVLEALPVTGMILLLLALGIAGGIAILIRSIRS